MNWACTMAGSINSGSSGRIRAKRRKRCWLKLDWWGVAVWHAELVGRHGFGSMAVVILKRLGLGLAVVIVTHVEKRLPLDCALKKTRDSSGNLPQNLPRFAIGYSFGPLL